MTTPAKQNEDRERFVMYPHHELSVSVTNAKGEQLLSFTLTEIHDIKQINAAILRKLPFEGYRRIRVKVLNLTTEQGRNTD